TASAGPDYRPAWAIASCRCPARCFWPRRLRLLQRPAAMDSRLRDRPAARGRGKPAGRALSAGNLLLLPGREIWRPLLGAAWWQPNFKLHRRGELQDLGRSGNGRVNLAYPEDSTCIEPVISEIKVDPALQPLSHEFSPAALKIAMSPHQHSQRQASSLASNTSGVTASAALGEDEFLALVQLQYPPVAAAAIILAVLIIWTRWWSSATCWCPSVQNWFLASLAFADLLLGLLVMPFSLVKQLLGAWVFGLWLAIDVLACTASIMNLCLISLDRYWSVSKALTYPAEEDAAAGRRDDWRRLAAVRRHLPAAAAGLAEAAGPGRTDIGYVMYSSMGSFYIPMLIMLFVYARIFRPPDATPAGAARLSRCRRQRRQPLRRRHRRSEMSTRCDALLGGFNSAPPTPTPSKTELDRMSNRMSMSEPDVEPDVEPDEQLMDSGETAAVEAARSPQPRRPCRQPRRGVAAEAPTGARARERRATLVLGLIMGAFVLCWFPFFTTYLTDIFCGCVPLILFDFFFWLGYCNSALNPVIYTVFNKDFRQAFRRILTCGRR
uniref:G_PROTEIN_RECEP_F1_2 domain-containing protein n=1 Tax=Macrostomum lignano TaxID=282301 RepID=A0A1I8FQH0_9PLAT